MQVVEAGPEGETILNTIRADIAEVPSIVGEVAFFMGVVQPDTVKAQNDGDAKVITLSKQDYEDLITRYPEQHDIVTGNLLLPFGLDKQGNEEGAATTAAAHDVSTGACLGFPLRARLGRGYTRRRRAQPRYVAEQCMSKFCSCVFSCLTPPCGFLLNTPSNRVSVL